TRISRTFKFSLAILLLLVCASFLTENLILRSQSKHALYQATTGNQKMLSQRISMLAFALLHSENPETSEKVRQSLLKNALEMEKGQYILLSDDTSAGLAQSERDWFTKSPINLDSRVKEYINQARELAKTEDKDINITNTNLHSIVSASSGLLEDFETLSSTLKQKGLAGVKKIQNFSNFFSGIRVLLLISLGLFIFSPLLYRLDFEFRERTRYEQKLLSSNRDLEQFASIAAHDIRGPLQNIKSFAELLSEDGAANDKGTVTKYLEQIKKGIVRLETLVKDLLDYSRTSSGELIAEFVDVNAIIDQIKSENLELVQADKLFIDSGKIPKIYGDKILLNVLFKNVLSNSIKYSSNKEKVHIRVLTSPLEKKSMFAEIAIEDNGIGFATENLDDVFKAFYREDQALKFPGTGLGLAICHRIVKKHKGTIKAGNSELGGAKIIIKLPIYKERTKT
ncbi:MAG: HAMP domain-containing histidine kinase, partial [Bdellovibrionales bacterium]|nr:HAMP domain-containing histidine kinase [Bdellovibrionales bacterium]